MVWEISYLEIVWRLFLASVLAGLVGWERERHQHPAGFRTHILVSIGSALIMLISIYGFSEFMTQANVRFDPSRISAQVVSGIGFLGAGTILRQRGSISGLTTAASLWVVAGIGLAVGAGFIFGAVLSTILALFSLVLLNRIERYLLNRRSWQVIHMTVTNEPGKVGEIASFIAQEGGSIQRINIDENSDENGKVFLDLNFCFAKNKPDLELVVLSEKIKSLPGVKRVHVE